MLNSPNRSKSMRKSVKTTSSQTTSKNSISRRDFLTKSAAVGAGLTILPSAVVSGLGHKMPSDMLNIACVGVGGRGAALLRELQSENVVALCDVDWAYA